MCCLAQSIISAVLFATVFKENKKSNKMNVIEKLSNITREYFSLGGKSNNNIQNMNGACNGSFTEAEYSNLTEQEFLEIFKEFNQA